MVSNGYGSLLQVMGRRFSDFLKGLDNLHEYFRFSYPKIRPPSFYCSKETSHGLTLHYRSRRRGYIAYVIGQLLELAEMYFDLQVEIEVVKKLEKGSFQFIVLKIQFENEQHVLGKKLKERSAALNEFLPIDPVDFLSMFPFFIAFNKKMEIVLVGLGLENVGCDLLGNKIDEQFDLHRPCIRFTWEGCQSHLNCSFHLESFYPIHKKAKKEAITFKVNDMIEDKVNVIEEKQEDYAPDEEGEDLPYLQLKGPMIYLKQCELIVYLPTVVVEQLDDLFRTGLYLDDYGEADCNREIILATVQKSDDMKHLLKSEKQRSYELACMMKEIDKSKKQALDLLCTMMPRDVAKELLNTGKASAVCNSFDEVTIAFVKICDFLLLTTNLDAAGTVNLLNSVYSHFDEVITRHGVYKVETVGESYMISCGVPYKTEYHAEYIGDACLDILVAIKNMDYKVRGKTPQIKIGIFSGSCVGGVVGKRSPRFCLFGDTVNCASRLESHNKQVMTIQAGQQAKEFMDRAAPQKFKFKHRGVVTLKGKGEMKAFGLIGKAGRPRYQTHVLQVEEEEEENEDTERIYTPIGDDDRDRNSTMMSRMSIGNISRTTGASSRSTTSMSYASFAEDEAGNAR